MPTPPDVNALVLRWWPLATGIARKWGDKYPWLSDCFESLAGECLWRLATTHGHLAEFPGFVRRGVRWVLIRRIHQEYTRNRVAFGQSAPAGGAGDDEPPTVFAALADAAPDVGAELDAADEVAALIRRAKLTPYQRALVVGRYFGGESLATMADELGVTASGARGSLGLALQKIRAAAG